MISENFENQVISKNFENYFGKFRKISGSWRIITEIFGIIFEKFQKKFLKNFENYCGEKNF